MVYHTFMLKHFPNYLIEVEKVQHVSNFAEIWLEWVYRSLAYSIDEADGNLIKS